MAALSAVHNIVVEDRIADLISHGKFEEVIDLYLSGTVTSALGLHGVFVAFCATKGLEYRLSLVHETARGLEARGILGYHDVALDFERDWALYFAEVKNDLAEARRIIDRVTEEGGTTRQRVLGKLADGKITLREDKIDAGFKLIDEARNLAYQHDLPNQVLRDCDWWYEDAITLKGEHALASKLARFLRPEEPKGSRRWMYLVAGWAPFGTHVTKVVFERELKLGWWKASD